MKRIILVIIMLQARLLALACPVCERQEPKILRGIVHGGTPQSQWDYVIVWATVLIVILTLFFSIKWLIEPGEKSDIHIKRFILNTD